jgi:hypothetical protein
LFARRAADLFETGESKPGYQLKNGDEGNADKR